MSETLLPRERNYDTAEKPKACPAKCEVCTECTFPECFYPEILKWKPEKLRKVFIEV